jgi:hypothetical protein
LPSPPPPTTTTKKPAPVTEGGRCERQGEEGRVPRSRAPLDPSWRSPSGEGGRRMPCLVEEDAFVRRTPPTAGLLLDAAQISSIRRQSSEPGGGGGGRRLPW